MPQPLNIKCFECKHFTTSSLPEVKKAPDWTHYCRAFPDDGIPVEIVSGMAEHDKVRPDQQGEFVFEKDPNIIL